jgi:peptidoglycan hydrolase CwlO-like protein
MIGSPARARAAATAVAVLVLALGLAIPARASELTDARARLEQLRTEIASHERALAVRHRHLDAIQAEIADLVAASAQIRAELARVRGELADAQAVHAELRERLDEAARTAYERGPMGPVAVALGAESMGDLADRVQYFDRISDSNADLADELRVRTAKLMADLATAQALSVAVARQDLRLRTKEAALLDELERQQGVLAALDAARAEAAGLVQRLALPSDPELTGAGVSYGRWAELLLGRLGAPVCPDNLTLVVAWQAAEGTAAAHNPLATTHDFDGATDFNSVGVKNYPSLDAGLDATIETLHGPESYGYGAILASLAACSPAMASAQAINASAWCRGCAGGMYVMNVVPLVQADYERFAVR